ncbi:MAG: MFS transporter [Planctomycetes bacterium]|nr:MFS transporter [Planctomycetota bacterium]MCB9919565.1 MFS transporter [Planctomycetota bacterium]
MNRTTESSPDAHTRLMPLVVSQFLGAFNDNAFKMIVVLIGFASVAGQGEAAEQGVTTLAFVVLTLPLMFGSIPAMIVGDRISKRDLVVWTKGAELALMLVGTIALWWQPDGWLPFVVLGGMGLQSALFAPGKYGLLPELVPPEALSRANGRLEAASFAAIILGTVAGGLLLQAFPGRVWIAGGILALLSAIGLWAALLVPRVAKSGHSESPREVFHGAWHAIRTDRMLWLATIGMVLFWSVASVLGQDVLVYGKRVLGLGDGVAALPYALFAIGVGVGSLLAGRIGARAIEVGSIPLGAILLSIGTIAMGTLHPGVAGTFVCMTVLGVASGLVIVPLNALFQSRAPASRRGAVIALVNMLSFAGMIVGNFGCLGLASIGVDSASILGVVAIITTAAAVWAIATTPGALIRLVIVLAVRVLYRMQRVGALHVPSEGGVLLVSNHVSFCDGFLMMAATDRQIRFLVERAWYDRPLLRPLWRAIGAIPISTDRGPRALLRSLGEAGAALDAGEVVCIFAEGEISRTGSLLTFQPGMQRLVRGRSAVVVPVHLDRVFESPGSSHRGRLRVLPRRFPVPVTVSFGEPLETDVSPSAVRAAVQGLESNAAMARQRNQRPLHARFVQRVRRAPWRACLSDSEGRCLSRVRTLAGALLLAQHLEAHAKRDRAQGDSVGILLPPSMPGALAAIATSLAGRIAVPLNYTVGRTAMQSALRQAEPGVLVSSRAFVERLPTDLVRVLTAVPMVYVEDVFANATRGARIRAFVRALVAPLPALERAAGAARRVRGEDVATILFSSGSTGEPKGIVLTHDNVRSNCEAVAQVVPLDGEDTLASVLPLFHSFGNMALWFVLGQGARIAFHPNPLDGAAVGKLVAARRATVLIATPTFLQNYQRRVDPGQFGSLRLVLTGAERLTDALADSFEDRFGLRPVQGYGVTECSPVIATSAPDYRAADHYQAGSRRSSVGRPVPGVTVRIVDPDTGEPVANSESGLILVRGANVMQGYLGREDLTALVLVDGYYDTGDIGYVDEDGFLYLTDRRSRFSKIGGEMVPHGVVEDALQTCSGEKDRAFVVYGVPDAKKGERLVVVTTLSAARVLETLEQMPSRGLPPLFVPRSQDFVQVDELPLLGTGKLDLGRIRTIADEASRSVLVTQA